MKVRLLAGLNSKWAKMAFMTIKENKSQLTAANATAYLRPQFNKIKHNIPCVINQNNRQKHIPVMHS